MLRYVLSIKFEKNTTTPLGITLIILTFPFGRGEFEYCLNIILLKVYFLFIIYMFRTEYEIIKKRRSRSCN